MGGTFDVDRVSKRRLLTELERVRALAEKYVQLSLIVAAELYRYDPGADVFVDGTFVPESVKRVSSTCAEKYTCQRHGGRLFRLARWFTNKLIPRRDCGKETRDHRAGAVLGGGRRVPADGPGGSQEAGDNHQV